jgi:hypothetical protein
LPDDVGWHSQLLRTDQMLIALYEELGEPDRARALFTELEDLAGGVPAESLAHRDWNALARTYAAMARIVEPLDPNESRRQHERGLEMDERARTAWRAGMVAASARAPPTLPRWRGVDSIAVPPPDDPFRPRCPAARGGPP